MAFICPVCNGFTPLGARCRSCGRPLEDAGRLYDFYGDYSPYQPIEDAKLSNGMADSIGHLCLHLGWCTVCRSQHLLPIREWSESQVFAATEE